MLGLHFNHARKKTPVVFVALVWMKFRKKEYLCEIRILPISYWSAKWMFCVECQLISKILHKYHIDSLIYPKENSCNHHDVIKWRHFPRYWQFVRGIHRPPVNSPHKGQWRGALIFSLICVRINGWVNNRGAGDLRHHRAHYDVIVIIGSMSQMQLVEGQLMMF